MKDEKREFVLKVAAASCAALMVLYYTVLGPVVSGWSDQSKRIADLRAEVAKGEKLLDREKILRDRWAGMMRENPPADDSAAEYAAFKAVGQWERDSGVTFTNVTKQKNWEEHDEALDQAGKTSVNYSTLEFTVLFNSSQAAIGKFLYEMQNDAIPVNLESCAITPRDARGSQLSLTATFTFLRLPATENNTR